MASGSQQIGLLASRVAKLSSKRRSAITPNQPRHLCPHCNRNLCAKTLKKHKRLYFNDDGTWISANESVEFYLETSTGIQDSPFLSDFEDTTTDHLNQTEEHVESSDSSSNEEPDSDEVWCEEYPDSDIESDYHPCNTPTLPTFDEFSAEHRSSTALSLWLTGFLLSLQAKFYIPDSALDLLIKFISALFNILCRFSPSIKLLAKCFPASLYIMRKNVGLDDSFTKFVVCPKCSNTYSYSDCVNKVGSSCLSKRCSFVKYPNHPHSTRRQPCGALLLKTVEFASGKTFLYPFKVFCYQSLKLSLQNMLLRPGFFENCQLWRNRMAHDHLEDIYDAAMWSDFQQYLGTPFLSSPHSFAFALNVDWFQPYQHTTFSVGVLYLTILNLPRTIRYKRENAILIGIIPGPHEPKLNINSFLMPLVEELLQFWNGIQLSICGKDVLVKAGVLCVACDLPAGRKTCGFLGHTAKLGCSKCLKSFPGEFGKKDYSGFERSMWSKRDDKHHRENLEKIKASNTQSKTRELESLYGVRYSCLVDLPYFDAPRMLCIDPMHNLFLGTGKHMITVWIDKDWICKDHFKIIQDIIDSFRVPSDIGRIPLKIESGFSGFKADQFKNWIIIYSIPALFDILPSEQLECWRHYVLACRILCKQCLSQNDIILADALLMQFCHRFENLYGQSSVTPNMHMHGHLKDSILDFGPIQEFWLFSFERYNGILGNQPNNNRVIEPQLMRRFLRDNFAMSFKYPLEFSEDFSSIAITNRAVGSIGDTLLSSSQYQLPSKFSRGVFDAASLDVLRKLFCIIHPQYISDNVIVNSTYLKFTSFNYKHKTFSSSGSKKQSSYIVNALWKEDIHGTPPTTLPDSGRPDSNIRPVNVHYYVKSTFIADSTQYSLNLAYVSWYSPHPKRYYLGKPAELWCNMHEIFGVHSFLPLDNILCRCVHGTRLQDGEKLIVVVSLVE